jgi:hypothetical protein
MGNVFVPCLAERTASVLLAASGYASHSCSFQKCKDSSTTGMKCRDFSICISLGHRYPHAVYPTISCLQGWITNASDDAGPELCLAIDAVVGIPVRFLLAADHRFSLAILGLIRAAIPEVYMIRVHPIHTGISHREPRCEQQRGFEEASILFLRVYTHVLVHVLFYSTLLHWFLAVVGFVVFGS